MSNLTQIFRDRTWLQLALLGLSFLLFLTIALLESPSSYRIYSLVSSPYIQAFLPNSMSLARQMQLYKSMAYGVENFTIFTTLYFFINYLVVALLGYLLTAPFFTGGKNLSLLKLLASFLVGYIAIIPLIRIISLFVSYNNIYWPVLGATLAIIIYKFVRQPELLRQLMVRGSAGESRINLTLLGILLAMLFGGALVMQVFQVDFFWFGHSNVAPYLEAWKNSNMGRFPIITQHYEDLIFHYFFSAQLPPIIPAVLPWWVSLALLKISLGALLYFSFRKLELSFGYSILATLFLLLGTTSILPHKYYLMFEYGNPIFFMAVSGRVLAVALFLFMIVALITESSESRLPKLSLVLIGLGMTAITLPSAAWLLIFFLVVALFKVYHQTPGREKSPLIAWEERAELAIIFTALLSMLLLYAWEFNTNSVLMIKSVLVLAVLLMMVVWLLRRVLVVMKMGRNTTEFKNSLISFSFLAGAITIGLLILGNTLVNNGVTTQMILLLRRLVGEIYLHRLTSGFLSTGSFAIGDYRTTISGSHYSFDVSHFLAYYGGLLMMILVARYLYSRNRHRATTAEKIFYETFVVAVALIPLFLWFTDYVGIFPSFSWNKTRFIEMPFYYIIFYFLYSVGRYLSGRALLVAMLILVIYIVTPFISMGRHKQLYKNWIFLKQLPVNHGAVRL